jgi:hypothetical protein
VRLGRNPLDSSPWSRMGADTDFFLHFSKKDSTVKSSLKFEQFSNQVLTRGRDLNLFPAALA